MQDIISHNLLFTPYLLQNQNNGLIINTAKCNEGKCTTLQCDNRIWFGLVLFLDKNGGFQVEKIKILSYWVGLID